MTEGEKVKYDLMCCLVLGGSEKEKHEAMRNALMCINQLEAQNAELQAERDAAVRDIDLNSRCHACRKFFKNGGECSGGIICISRRFEWRGVQKEDGNA